MDKCNGFGKNPPVYHVYPVSRTTGDGRAEIFQGVGAGGGGGGVVEGGETQSVQQL